MDKPLISVIVPAYNEEENLSKCLIALKKQDFEKAYEIIVIDNNSTDNTALVAQKFGVKIVKEAKQGFAFARKRGFFCAKAPIIASTDADSIVPNNWLSSIYKAFLKKEVIAVCGIIDHFESNFIIRFFLLAWFFSWEYIAKALIGHYLLLGSNMAIRTFAVRNVKRSLNQYNEDLELGCHLVDFGQITFMPKIIVKTSSRAFLRSKKDIFCKYIWGSIVTLSYHHPFKRCSAYKTESIEPKNQIYNTSKTKKSK